MTTDSIERIGKSRVKKWVETGTYVKDIYAMDCRNPIDEPEILANVYYNIRGERTSMCIQIKESYGSAGRYIKIVTPGVIDKAIKHMTGAYLYDDEDVRLREICKSCDKMEMIIN